MRRNRAIPARGTRQSGFTLVELAIVVLVIGLLLGGLIVPLSAQIEQRRVADTQRMLAEIREALIGFAIVNRRLPCPSYEEDPSNANYGAEAASCQTTPVKEGYLPWRTLGVRDIDAWGVRRRSAGDLRIGDWRYRVDRNFASATTPLTITTSFVDNIRVLDAAGIDLTTTTERAVAIAYSTGPNTLRDGHNASFEQTNPVYQAADRTATFDDMTIWIGRPLLVGRLVAAGVLP